MDITFQYFNSLLKISNITKEKKIKKISYQKYSLIKISWGEEKETFKDQNETQCIPDMCEAFNLIPIPAKIFPNIWKKKVLALINFKYFLQLRLHVIVMKTYVYEFYVHFTASYPSNFWPILFLAQPHVFSEKIQVAIFHL